MTYWDTVSEMFGDIGDALFIISGVVVVVVWFVGAVIGFAGTGYSFETGEPRRAFIFLGSALFWLIVVGPFALAYVAWSGGIMAE